MKTIQAVKIKDHGGGFSRYEARCPFCGTTALFDQDDRWRNLICMTILRCWTCKRKVKAQT